MTDNPSGIIPIEYKVLVKPKKIEEITQGGIILPTDTVELEQGAMNEGELVVWGGQAFERQTETPWPEYTAKIIEQGVSVIYPKHRGLLIIGEDGQEYRMMNDSDIVAIRSKQ